MAQAHPTILSGLFNTGSVITHHSNSLNISFVTVNIPGSAPRTGISLVIRLKYPDTGNGKQDEKIKRCKDYSPKDAQNCHNSCTKVFHPLSEKYIFVIVFIYSHPCHPLSFSFCWLDYSIGKKNYTLHFRNGELWNVTLIWSFIRSYDKLLPAGFII